MEFTKPRAKLNSNWHWGHRPLTKGQSFMSRIASNRIAWIEESSRDTAAAHPQLCRQQQAQAGEAPVGYSLLLTSAHGPTDKYRNPQRGARLAIIPLLTIYRLTFRVWVNNSSFWAAGRYQYLNWRMIIFLSPPAKKTEFHCIPTALWSNP